MLPPDGGDWSLMNVTAVLLLLPELSKPVMV